MSKIVVKKQEYANNGTHANEIEAVVKENILTNTLSTSTDNAPTVGLLKTVSDNTLKYCKANISPSTSKVFNIPSGSRHLFAITTLNTAAVGLYSIGATGAGAISWVSMFAPAEPIYTFARDGNSFTISNTGSISLDMIFINVSGNPMTIVS